jgi:divalent metal cation (Fe/Co/Zn/Cd) transporter
MSSPLPDLTVIDAAIHAVALVKGVSSLQALERADGGIVVVARIGLSPTLRLTEVVYTISEVDSAVRHADPRVQAVFVEPDIAADAATPTETIVIRALD